MAILMDGNSASASEIVAACLQDNGRAAIVGTRSYGKGTVQNILPLQYGRSALRLTVARYYRPNGKNIHRKKDASDEDEWGVRPDDGMEVELDEDSLEKLAKRFREASYPSLASAEAASRDNKDRDNKDRDNEDGGETGGEADGQSGGDQPDADRAAEATAASKEPGTVESGLMIDPQLRRAVEYLREVIETASDVTTAA
jgi:carboxyl-terminal processing protease